MVLALSASSCRCLCLFVSLQSSSLRRLQRTLDWQVRVLRQRFGCADPSCVQDQGVISSCSNRRTTPCQNQPSSQHPSSDFGGVAWCGKARVTCCSSRVRRLLLRGRRILQIAKVRCFPAVLHPCQRLHVDENRRMLAMLRHA